MKKTNWEEIGRELEAMCGKVLGDRVALLIDDREEEFGNSGIQRVSEYTSRPLMATVVLLGTAARDIVKDDLQPGARILFNRIAPTIDRLHLPSGAVEIAFMSTKDCYFRWED